MSLFKANILAPAKATVTNPTQKDTSTHNASTTVQVDGALSVLKKKTTQEILNRWNHDLDNYTKEFHKVAVQVSMQDRQLLENGFNVHFLQKLIHNSRFESYSRK